ncbi:tape measure protein [Pseudomonas leptonychotis]|uniref:tape measure protein n=1 Tax=Pseudomonas leptonychotis TaxID=2448482 RepID=UPI003869D9A7
MTDIELRLTADVAQATKGVGAFSKQYRELVSAIEKPLKQVGAFRTLEASLEGIEQQSRVARDRVRDLGNELASASNPSKALTASYKDAVAELQRLTRAESQAQSQLAKRRRELQSAKIDTSNLTAEQKRLSAELAGASLAGRRDAATSGIRAQSAALGQLAREQRLANLEQAKADFGISRARQYEGALAQLSSQFQLLRRNGNLTNRELSIAQRAYTQRVIETKTAMGQLAVQQQKLRGGGSLGLGVVSGVGAAYATVSAIKGIAAQADAYNLMNARLKLATSSQEEFTTAQTELGRIAQATQAPVASLVTLYGRISRPLKEAGRSQADILKVTEAVATSFRVSGATAEEAQNGVIQFAQALGAGALRGDEFNSVAEQAPRLMQALADSIGVPVGALREMAKQGLLTADVVTGALVGQLDVLRKEAETLPATVGGAMTALSDQWNKAIGQADIQPLIDAIDSLAETITDPATVESLIALASAIATLGSALVTGADWFVSFGKELGYVAARASGASDRILEVERSIRILEAAEKGVGLADLFQSDEEIKKNLARARAEYARLTEMQTGFNAEMQFLAEVGVATAESVRQKEIDANTKYIGEVKTLQGEQVKAAKKFAKSLVAAEKKANAELEKVKKDRLDIEKRYSTALAELGGTGDASYSNAQSLKVGARAALKAGDVEGAQAQAQAALKMLQDLAAAGENTYGFSGFIKELEAIELAANDIEQTNAENKIKAIQDQIKSLEVDAAKLKDLPLSIKSDDASIEAVRSQIQALVTEMGQKEIVLPVRVVHPDGPIISDLPPLPGFATGGKLRGPGTGTSDSILMWGSNGEFMQPKSTVDYYGEGFMEALRQRRIPKFATGGPISERSLPAIPSMNPALTAGPSFPDLGRVAFEMGGEQFSVYASPGDALDLKRLAAKFGGTSR